MTNATDHRCALCGAPLKQSSGPGRPAKFCSKACKRSADLRVRRLNEHIARLEIEAEHCRRDVSGLHTMSYGSPTQKAEGIARELAAYEEKLRELLAALEGEA